MVETAHGCAAPTRQSIYRNEGGEFRLGGRLWLFAGISRRSSAHRIPARHAARSSARRRARRRVRAISTDAWTDPLYEVRTTRARRSAHDDRRAAVARRTHRSASSALARQQVSNRSPTSRSSCCRPSPTQAVIAIENARLLTELRAAHARSAGIARIPDRDQRRAQGHQPLDLRPAAGARYAGRDRGAALRGRDGSSSALRDGGFIACRGIVRVHARIRSDHRERNSDHAGPRHGRSGGRRLSADVVHIDDA